MSFSICLANCSTLPCSALTSLRLGTPQTGNGTVQTLVKSLFQLVPLAHSLVLDFFNLGLGAIYRSLDRFNLFVDVGLGQLLRFLAILYQLVKQAIAVLADLGKGAQTSQPDLTGVLLDLADPGSSLLSRLSSAQVS